LKTSVLNYCRKFPREKLPLHDVCASFQEAVVEVLVEKTILAAAEQKINTIVLGGGVSCNSRLRQVFDKRCKEEGFSFFVPDPIFCTDNGAMIGFAGYHKFNRFGPVEADEDVYSRSILY